jgi:hypothetical protein
VHDAAAAAERELLRQTLDLEQGHGSGAPSGR